ncbi:MAG: DNA gyrase subunit A [Myxococcales bacterium]|nr:DNA gyrase subunit A [Polyangiaceae bacterium]MDW8248025.1 DNA gyrase subunit A [Myxococcales bacterium]
MTQSTNIDQKIPVNIQDELKVSYLDYAMSVIIGRALPDVRDGLKPVHRRILFSMSEQKITAAGPFKKCARVVGDVIAKYHPHGDAAVYDALVRLAQDFSMRHRLVEGQGNFGSVDGDPAAAYRYTECRLTKLSQELLADLDKETVDMLPNFDDSEQEPSVLPARWPNLLVNGSEGIAVGMATKIPPHNLGEVIDATIALIENPAISTEALIEKIPGPDFPTGGLIYGRAGIEQAYRTGRGSLYIRARTVVEKALGKSDREQLVVTEIPYQVNKARLARSISELVRDKKLDGIAEVRDESDREGIRLVIELKKDAVPQVVLNNLFQHTDMQVTFGIINLSIDRGRPVILGLKETLERFVDHRRDVVTRRCSYELRKAEAQRELILGLGMATTDVDAVVQTIRESPDLETAKVRLMRLPLKGLEEFVRRAGRPEGEIQEARGKTPFHLTETQAKAILEMRLSRLTGLEREKLAQEYGAVSDEIGRLKAILSNTELLMSLIIDELRDIKARYAEPRRTEIIPATADINPEDLIPVQEMVVTVSRGGYIKRTPSNEYQPQKRGGKGKIGHKSVDEDVVSKLFIASTHDHVLIFSDKGKVYAKKVWEIPEAAPNSKGRSIVNFVEMEQGERIAAVVTIRGFFPGNFVVTLTKKGLIKKTELTDYGHIREKGIIGVKLDEGDELLSAEVTDGTREFLIATRSGMSIRFPEKQVRDTGRGTLGVKAITLDEGDEVVSFTATEEGRSQVLAICERGYGKRTDLNEYRIQNRGGKGVTLINTSERNGPVVGVLLVRDDDQIMLVTEHGQTLRTTVDKIRVAGRNTQGVRVMDVADNDRISAIERLAEKEENGDSTPPPEPENHEPTHGVTSPILADSAEEDNASHHP